MSWTDERIEALKTMWEAGRTASQIAEELGGVSRNAVIGKAHRLGLQSRPSPVKPNETPAPEPVVEPVAAAQMPKPVVEASPEPEPEPVVAPEPAPAPSPSPPVAAPAPEARIVVGYTSGVTAYRAPQAPRLKNDSMHPKVSVSGAANAASPGDRAAAIWGPARTARR